jgi:DNA-binding transcriptional ArsR family regulator
MSETISPVSKELHALSLVLKNVRRLQVLEYLERCIIATNLVIVFALRLRQSQVSKDLKILLAAKLVKKEKAGTLTVYRADQEKWLKFKDLLMAIEIREVNKIDVIQ